MHTIHIKELFKNPKNYYNKSNYCMRVGAKHPQFQKFRIYCH